MLHLSRNYADQTKQEVQIISLSPVLITQINSQNSDRCNCPICSINAQIMVT